MYSQSSLIPGSKIRTRGKFLHYGIVFQSSWWGPKLVIHNLPDRGVICTIFEEFSGGQRVEVVWSPNPQEGPYYARRAYSQVGQPYNLFNANCEHFANWVISGVPFSEQLQIGIFLSVLIGVAAFVSIEKK